MRGPSPRCAAAAGLAVAATLFAPAAIAQQVDLDRDVIPDLFAGLMTLTLSDEISTGSFRVDNGGNGSDDTTFTTLRLPWRHEFEGASQFYVEGIAGALWADDGFSATTASGISRIDYDWLAIGGQVGLGWTQWSYDGWRVRPGLGAALGHIDNDAEYNAAAEIDVAPIVDGTILNWDAWAAVYSASLTVDRPRDHSRPSFGCVTRYVLASTEVFSSSSEAQEGDDSSQFATVRGEFGAPVSFYAGDVDSEWDVFGGWVGLFNVDPDALGFDEFFELGAGLTFRPVSHWPRVRVGGASIFGEDITGWSLGLTLVL